MRPLTVKLVASVLVLVVLGWVAAMLFNRSALPAEFAQFEWIVALLAVPALVGWWRSFVRRRERQKLEEMRDSALW
jgi:membrane protein implicated in regulation of membrane protease activity